MKVRFALSTAVVLGATASGVEARADTEPGDAPSAGADAPSAGRADAAAVERARAYAAWQQQYGTWQYQYAAWLAAQRQPPRRWYGWQTLVSDGVSVSLAIAGVAIANDSHRSEDTGAAIAVGGFLSFLVVPPIIHLAHGNGGNAAISVGIRLGATALVFAGAYECGRSSRRCDDGYNVLAFIGALGYPAAVVVDAALAHEDVSPNEEVSLTLVPWFGPTRDGGVAGLLGAF